MSKEEFVSKIEKENEFITEVNEASKKENGVYIFGNGWGSKRIADLLSTHGITIKGKLVSRKFFDPTKDEKCFEEVIELPQFEKEKCKIIMGVTYYDPNMIKDYSNRIDVIYYDVFYPFEDIILGYSWVEKHVNELYSVYMKLEDKISKDTYVAYINQRITSNWGYLKKVRSSEPQYFEKDIIHLKTDEVFVDCGAYDGDSAQSFIDALAKQGVVDYKEIISFEPDDINYKKMIERKIKKHRCVKKGVSDSTKEVLFKGGDGTSSKFGEGDELLSLCTIDDELKGEKVTFIKMDIEGMEIEALKGAIKSIKTSHPKLAICIYHKKEHLYEIQQLIYEIDNSYKFFVRAYEDRTTELVLYAI